MRWGDTEELPLKRRRGPRRINGPAGEATVALADPEEGTGGACRLPFPRRPDGVRHAPPPFLVPWRPGVGASGDPGVGAPRAGMESNDLAADVVGSLPDTASAGSAGQYHSVFIRGDRAVAPSRSRW
jgi:hypothetical protein